MIWVLKLKPIGKAGISHDLQATIDHGLLDQLLEEKALPYLPVDGSS